MAKPIQVTILGDVQDLLGSLADGDKGLSAFAGKVGSTAKEIAGTAAKFAAAGLAAGGIGAALSESLDRAQLGAKLAAQLGATADESKRYGEAAGKLYADGYGDSFGQVTEAIGAVTTTLGKLDQGELETVTKKALNLANAFDLELNQAVASSGILLKVGLAKDANEAFDLMTKGLQGVPAALRPELLEAIDEYGVFFKEIGFTGAESFGVLKAAASGGKIQLDKAGDAIKEFHIRATDGSKTTVDAYKALGLNADEMAQKIARGGTDARDGFQQIINGLLAMKDPVEQSNTAVGLFGTQFEDLAHIDALAALSPMANGLQSVAGSADALGKTLHDNASANLDTFMRKVSTLFVDLIGGYVLPIISSVTSYLNRNFGPALSAVGSFIGGTLVPAVRSLAEWISVNQTPILLIAGLITALFLPHLIALGVTHTATAAKAVAAWAVQKVGAIQAAVAHSAQVVRMVASWVLLGAQSLINAAKMAAAWVLAMGPVGWIIAAVVALVALIVANWETVKEWTVKAWESVWTFIKQIGQWIWDYFLKWTLPGLIITHWDTIVNAVRAAVRWVLDAVAWLGELPGRVGAWFRGVYDGAVGRLSDLTGWLRGLPGSVLGAIGNFGSLLLNAGRDLLSGLWSGIQNAAGWLRDKVLGFFSSIMPDWVRDALGIHSPSRVMAAIGRFIPPGIALGIEQNSATAVGAALGLAADVTSALTDMGTTGPVGLGLVTGAALATGAATALNAGRSGSAGYPAPDSAGSAAPVHQEVTVNVTTNADPTDIGNEVAWALRTSGR
jgi:phage-related minor tail protein